MVFTLLPFRILVNPDDGSDTIGVIVAQNLRGDRSLIIEKRLSDPNDPESPILPEVHHDHVVFVKENVVEVEIDGATHLAMHLNNVVGYIPE